MEVEYHLSIVLSNIRRTWENPYKNGGIKMPILKQFDLEFKLFGRKELEMKQSGGLRYLRVMILTQHISMGTFILRISRKQQTLYGDGLRKPLQHY